MQDRGEATGGGKVIPFERIRGRVGTEAKPQKHVPGGRRISEQEFAALGESSRGRQEQVRLLFGLCVGMQHEIGMAHDFADLSLIMAAMNTVQIRRGLIGQLLRPKVSLPELRKEMESMRAWRKEMVAAEREGLAAAKAAEHAQKPPAPAPAVPPATTPPVQGGGAPA
jgi:hypothetical protein